MLIFAYFTTILTSVGLSIVAFSSLLLASLLFFLTEPTILTSPPTSSTENGARTIRVLLLCSFLAVILLAFSVHITFGIVAALVVLAIAGFGLRKKLRKSAAEEEEDLIDHVSVMPRKFSVQELESATQNFSERLGGGGFGSVFRGSLDNGTRVAVKRLDLNLGQGRKEFLAEVKTIGSVHHFNLVRLLGFCAERYHKLLVYEYMSNGSLDSWIINQNQRFILDWPTRRKIILHMARGLSYLHEECSRRIIHLDIKPQNVLLDEEFNAKISDFGLARFIDRDQSQVQTTVRGTRGYMALEWFTNRGISEKVDVYSFGVVVLEILCGRKNLDRSQPEEDQVLLYLIRRKAEEDGLCDVVDAQNGDLLQNKEAAVKMLRLAIWCSTDDSRRRPSMSTVVKVLEDDMEIEDIVDPMELCVDVNEAVSALQSAEVLSGPR